MDINRQTLRRAGCLAAAALLALTLGAIGPDSQGDALGAVIAITPYEVIPNGFVGVVENPSLSGRGETAGVYDAEVEPPGVRVPRHRRTGADAARTGQHGERQRVHRDVGAEQRQHERRRRRVDRGHRSMRAAASVKLFRTNSGYLSGAGWRSRSQGSSASWCCNRSSPPSCSRSRWYGSTRRPAPTGHAAHGFPYSGWDANLGVDISDDGNVVVAVEAGQAISAAGAPIPLRDVVAWDVAVEHDDVRQRAAEPGARRRLSVDLGRRQVRLVHVGQAAAPARSARSARGCTSTTAPTGRSG